MSPTPLKPTRLESGEKSFVRFACFCQDGGYHGRDVIRTKRAMVFYLRDPGTGFRRESLVQVAGSNPANEPAAHIVQRAAEGVRLGGYGTLLAEARSTS